MRADELCRKFNMEGHVENGMFMELNPSYENGNRASSGAMYYYVGPETKTEFHSIDCDEYWVYNAGSDIDIWTVNSEGKMEILTLGTGENAQPVQLVKQGLIFACRHKKGVTDGTFLDCITVPHFIYDGLKLESRENMENKYPDLKAFWQD